MIIFKLNSQLEHSIDVIDISSNRASVTCETNQCIDQALNMHSSIDDSFTPCNKFYSFACGKFSASFDPEQRTLSRERLLQNEINQQLHELLTSSTELEPEVEQMNFIKQLYINCVSWTGEDDSSSLEQMVNQITSLKHASKKLAKMISFGESAVIDLKVKRNPFNSSEFIIWLDQPSFSIARIELLSRKANELSSSHVQSLITFAQLTFDFILGEEMNDREPIKRAIDFELELAKKSTKPYLHQDHKNILRKMTLAQLHREVSPHRLDFISLINNVAQYSHHELHVSWNDSVIVGDLDYLKHAVKLVSEMSTIDQSLQTLDTYLTIRLLQSYAFLVSPDLNSLENHLTGDFSAIDSFKIRDRCLNLLRQQAPELLDRYYAHIHQVTDDDISSICKIKTKIVKSYIDAIASDPELSWEDSEKLALKALNVTFNIAFPGWIFNSSHLSQHSPDLRLNETSHFNNSPVLMALHLKRQAFAHRLDLLMPSHSFQVDHWPVSSSSLSSSYDPLANSLTIPAAMIQPYYFHVNFTECLNYAGIGYFIAHGLMHAFTRQGIQYNQHGNLQPWLSEDSLDTFLLRQECVEQMYAYKYSSMDIKLDGERTIEENTADLAALKIAYHAYLSVKEGPNRFNLTSLDLYSNEQLFFIHFASTRCHLETEASLRYQVLNEPFSPTMVRILFSLINSEEFTFAFHCSNSTKMVPKARCKVL